MATTINSGYANSPKLTANIADHADVYGGRALVFDGVTDYLDCGDLTSTTRSNMTISFWFYRGTSGTMHICSRDDESSNRNWSIYIYDNLINFDCRISNVGKNTVGATAIPVYSWTHLAFTHNGSNQAWYVNGKLDGTSSHSGAIDNNNVNMYIGRRAGNYLNGKISDFKVYSSALTEAEVESQYLKPESVPNQNSLVAWYPMCEGNPESPQSIVYDHSEKKLGSELLNDSSFELSGEQSAGVSGTYYNLDSEVSISNGQLISNATSSTTTTIIGGISVVQGKTYKIEVVVASGSLDAKLRFNNSNNSVNTGFITFSEGLNTVYYSPSATTSLNRIVGSTSDRVWTIDSISFKEVLMGNHATTNFFGNMSDLLSSAQKTALGTMLDSDDNSFIFTNGNTPTGTNKFSAIDGTIEITSNTLKLTNDGTTKAHVALPFTTEVGKSYVAEIKLVTANMQGGLSISDDLEENTLIAGLSSGVIITSNTFVAIGTTSYVHIKNNQGNNNQYNLYDNLKVREVGVSSSGFETAVNEPVVPQVPLMRYNQKAIFDRNKNNYVSLTEQTLEANTAFTIAFLFIPFNANEHHMIGKNSVDDTIRVDTSGAHRIAIRINNDFGSMTGTGNVNANESHFCVITRTTGGAFSVYRNGVKSTASFTNTSDFKYQYLGQSLNGAWESDGLLDEFSIFNTHFSDAEAQELFNDGVAYDATTHSKSGNLLGYWRNDGVTTWQDRRGWSFLNFDGVDDHIQLPMTFSYTNHTISIWANHGLGSVQIFSAQDASSDGIRLLIDTSGRFQYRINGSNALVATAYTNQWVHYVCTYDGSTMRVYANGVQVKTNGTSQTIDTTTNARIGKSSYQNSGHYDSSLSSVALYSEYKDANEVLAIYNSGIAGSESSNSNLVGYYKLDNTTTVKDLSSNSNDGAVTGTTLNDGNHGDVQGSPNSITIREGLNTNRDALGFYFTNPSNNVLRLNGVDEHLKLPYTKSFDMGDGSFTVCAWVKTTLGVGDSLKTILWARDNNNSFKGFEFVIDDSADRPRFIIHDGSGQECLGSNNTVKSDKWHFVAVVVDKENGLAKIFLSESDGSALKCQTTTDISSKGNINATPDWYVGKRNAATTQDFMGIIDELMVYNIALTAFESDGTTVEAGDTVTSGELLKNYKFSKGKHKND